MKWIATATANHWRIHLIIRIMSRSRRLCLHFHEPACIGQNLGRPKNPKKMDEVTKSWGSKKVNSRCSPFWMTTLWFIDCYEMFKIRSKAFKRSEATTCAGLRSMRPSARITLWLGWDQLRFYVNCEDGRGPENSPNISKPTISYNPIPWKALSENGTVKHKKHRAAQRTFSEASQTGTGPSGPWGNRSQAQSNCEMGEICSSYFNIISNMLNSNNMLTFNIIQHHSTSYC